MKKTLFTLLVAMFTLTSCGKVDDKYYQRDDVGNGNEPDPVLTEWEEKADKSTGALIDKFWKGDIESYYYFIYYNDITTNTEKHYWPQAHAMDVVIDAYNRTKEQKYLDMFPLWFEGARKMNWASQNWKNPYIDDMEWIVLTQIRMYEATQNDEYLITAKQIYNDWIITEWSDDVNGGGILWSKDAAASKNACSNGPAAIIACKLHRLTEAGAEKDKYLADALKIYNWERAVLFNQTTGSIADHIAGGTVKGGALTYNQGTFVGAAHELYKITEEKEYLDDAVLASNFTISTGGLIDTANGVLRNEGTGDNGLFKGIFIRYFVMLINDKDIPTEMRQKFHKFLTHNATTLWTKGVDENEMLFSSSWTTPAYARTGLTEQVSGCMLIEAMNVLKPL